MFGRRGAIAWRKMGFFGGDGSLDYDAYQGWGLFGPFYLVQAVHSFGWGERPYRAWAIPLAPDRGFARRIFLQDWGGLLLFFSLLFFLPMCCSGYSLALTILTGIAALASGVTILVLFLTRGPHRDIRLVLGQHDWGSSDPATWHSSLVKRIVDPKKKFGVDSFAALAEQFLDDKEWSKAMWAARLCVAVEDEKEGEELTEDILAFPAVQKRLARLRKNPKEWPAAFGEQTPLSTWVRGDLETVIFDVSAQGWR